MPAHRQVEGFKPTARMISETVSFLKHLKEIDLPLKDVLLTLILGVDDNDELATLRRYWSSNRGWPSTLNILMAFKKAVVTLTYADLATHDGKPCHFISQATKIVAAESRPRSVFGPPTPAHRITHSFFGIARTAERYAALKRGTGFLWHLIRGSIGRYRQVEGIDETAYLIDPPTVSESEAAPSNPAQSSNFAAAHGDELSEVTVMDTDKVQKDTSDSSSSSEEPLVPLIEPDVQHGNDEDEMKEIEEELDWGDEEAGVIYVDSVDRKQLWTTRATNVANTGQAAGYTTIYIISV
ncbi:uncharacterized protein MELLADRAFT_95905 [Melampsora larici-populina 98AG31]|uniref:Uncharacterized protein n=1 Tax=Melampsora larici-populina (strain 98AG31 / pathotype 3-4-7) TaxID=747676 RepID=F4RDP6_MELLP|nr:uncharacterized protein MELLADRAFT_95905 [Melampsora larici-populina 98AG31]EGG09568.1 hypothetical protein MELLADRAFT_95905 [Melampsora larici-populina 98AG31]